jgi:HD superfamily phosphohydrolase
MDSIAGKSTIGPLDKPFLISLINSQLDADKSDYLLRDSHYAGVKYGCNNG